MLIKIIYFVILITSATTYASQNCPFPQHFKITGPSGLHIMEVSTGNKSDLIVKKSSDLAFEVLDPTQCEGQGINYITLKVGVDNYHYSEIIFTDGHESGDIKMIASSTFNRLYLKEFKSEDITNYKLVYQLDNFG